MNDFIPSVVVICLTEVQTINFSLMVFKRTFNGGCPTRVFYTFYCADDTKHPCEQILQLNNSCEKSINKGFDLTFSSGNDRVWIDQSLVSI